MVLKADRCGSILKFILTTWSCEAPVSFPLAIQDTHYVVLCSGLEEKLSQHDIASYTAKRHQLVCWEASISVNWVVGGASFLHTF